MGTLVKNELFKLRKKSSTWIMILLMFVIMLLGPILTILSGSEVMSYTAISSAGALWLVVTLISSAGSILSMEYEYGTIKELFASKYSRGKILISKWFTIFIYSIILNILLVVYTGIIYYAGRLLTTNMSFTWSENAISGETVTTMTESFLRMLASDFINAWLVISVVFLLASIIKKSSLAVTLGLVFFLTSSMISSLLSSLMKLTNLDWLKYTPFNMLFLNFNESTASLEKVAHLNATQLGIGSLIYIIIFLIIGLLFYRRKEV
ncbi:ABC transporter permease [Holzapfeliella floricola]|uniref:ABC superfamily ATP binding cassette transporter, membrane protein n=2 Tax=Holzapfeliella TaxID=2767883 RepID=A0A0R2DKU9_9LACO|nr:ABC transporter permease [Holzapfeliella floricola]KRN04728.1 ABC superfamily ATP binding cassette transporter, membrane protein [Holzapfeliella floricola DSM 23037 = JCM 16512]